MESSLRGTTKSGGFLPRKLGWRPIACPSLPPPRTGEIHRGVRGIGTEFLAYREKIEVTRQRLAMCALSGADEACASPPYARFLRLSPEKASNLRLCGGEGGIRTLGTGYPVRQISNLVPSTTRPPLRTSKKARRARYLRARRVTGNLALRTGGPGRAVDLQAGSGVALIAVDRSADSCAHRRSRRSSPRRCEPSINGVRDFTIRNPREREPRPSPTSMFSVPRPSTRRPSSRTPARSSGRWLSANCAPAGAPSGRLEAKKSKTGGVSGWNSYENRCNCLD